MYKRYIILYLKTNNHQGLIKKGSNVWSVWVKTKTGLEKLNIVKSFKANI